VNGGDFELGYVGLEFHPLPSGQSLLSLFVEAQRGEGGYDGFLVGLRFGSGPVDNAPLIPLFSTAARGVR